MGDAGPRGPSGDPGERSNRDIQIVGQITAGLDTFGRTWELITTAEL